MFHIMQLRGEDLDVLYSTEDRNKAILEFCVLTEGDTQDILLVKGDGYLPETPRYEVNVNVVNVNNREQMADEVRKRLDEIDARTLIRPY